MANFCRQCSLDMFDKDYKELANITTKEFWKQRKACVAICEHCGPIQIDPDGNCVSECHKPEGF